MSNIGDKWFCKSCSFSTNGASKCELISLGFAKLNEVNSHLLAPLFLILCHKSFESHLISFIYTSGVS